MIRSRSDPDPVRVGAASDVRLVRAGDRAASSRYDRTMLRTMRVCMVRKVRLSLVAAWAFAALVPIGAQAS